MSIYAAVDSREQTYPNQPIRIELLDQFIVCVSRFKLIGSKWRNYFPRGIESMP